MKTLTLSLKRKWFELIRDGVKLEEYREIKPFGVSRLTINYPDDFDIIERGDIKSVFQYFERLIFTCGYPKADDTSRRLEFKNPKIRIGTGRPEWGAVPGINYFVITWER